jgi:hypothetical protein
MTIRGPKDDDDRKRFSLRIDHKAGASACLLELVRRTLHILWCTVEGPRIPMPPLGLDVITIYTLEL